MRLGHRAVNGPGPRGRAFRYAEPVATGERRDGGGRGLFYKIRVAILATILFGVALYAVRDVRSRRARKDWERTLSIALVIVSDGPLAPDAVPALKAQVPALEARLASEAARRDVRSPFSFHVVGPVEHRVPPPAPSGDGIADLAAHALASYRWTTDVDAKTGESLSSYDSRIYLVAHAPRSADRQVVEGVSEDGGRVGTVVVDLDASMADLALIVVAHELFHTLGATDKYDEHGHARVPEGLAEPGRVPLYPQRFAEIMARNRPVGPAEEKVPLRIDELAVGDLTAREIGWAP